METGLISRGRLGPMKLVVKIFFFVLVQTADVCVFDMNGSKLQSGRAPSSDDPSSQRTEARCWL